MRSMMKTGFAVSVAFTLVCGCASFNQQPLKEKETIVFLGDSITAAGVRPEGYVTLTSKAIAKAYPDLDVKVIGAGISGHKVPDCQKRLDRDVLQKNKFDKMLDEYSDISRTVAKESGSQLLDLRNAFMTYLRKHNTDNVAKGILTRDSAHLNKNGNSFLAGLVLDALNVPHGN